MCCFGHDFPPHQLQQSVHMWECWRLWGPTFLVGKTNNIDSELNANKPRSSNTWLQWKWLALENTMGEPQTLKTVATILRRRGFLLNLLFIYKCWKEKTFGRISHIVFNQFVFYYGMDWCYGSLLFPARNIEFKYVDFVMSRRLHLHSRERISEGIIFLNQSPLIRSLPKIAYKETTNIKTYWQRTHEACNHKEIDWNLWQ